MITLTDMDLIKILQPTHHPPPTGSSMVKAQSLTSGILSGKYFRLSS